MLTGEVADVVMGWWEGEFVKLAKESNSQIMEEFILDCGLYIDDDILVFEFLPPGARWSEESRRMEVKQELLKTDLEEQEDVSTMREISKMADSICPELNTTFDCPGLHGEECPCWT